MLSDRFGKPHARPGVGNDGGSATAQPPVGGGVTSVWQVQVGVPVQKLQLQVQLPVPEHEPFLQFAEHVVSCAYTRWASRGEARSAAAANSDRSAILSCRRRRFCWFMVCSSVREMNVGPGRVRVAMMDTVMIAKGPRMRGPAVARPL